MQSRSLDDPNSWWFFAAIHGQYITTGDTSFPGWDFIPGPPQVPTTPLPSDEVIARYWDQCQHQSWFFLPWHRGYLIALEAQIRSAIQSLDGSPADWALPYWNYFGRDVEFKIPPAFTEQNLPDGTPNPLFVQARYGPNLRRPGDILVIKDTSGTPNNPNGITAICQNNTVYTGFNVLTQPPGFGGPPSGFLHSGGTGGNLEGNPHNLVHNDVGGSKFLTLFSVGLEFVNDLNNNQIAPGLSDAFQQSEFPLPADAGVRRAQPPFEFLWVISGGTPRRGLFVITPNEITNMLDIGSLTAGSRQGGLMSDPGMAALDPIFYLHHCNIDRMWAAWNAHGNSNETNVYYVNGPAAIGMRDFVMPMPNGTPWVYTPADVNSLDQVNYVYDNLNSTISPQPSNVLVQRLTRLGVAPAAASAAQAQGANMDGGERVELLGAHDGALQVQSSGARASVKLDPDVRGKTFASLANASAANLPDHVYLHLENVRGTDDAFKLNVSVNQQHVGTVALFGLRRASSIDGQHGGIGLNFIFDITNVMDNLFAANTPDVDSLDVSITPDDPFVDAAQITVGRVSVYRQGAS